MKSIKLLLIAVTLIPINTWCSVSQASMYSELKFERIAPEESDDQVLARLNKSENEDYNKKFQELNEELNEDISNLWCKIFTNEYQVKIKEQYKQLQNNIEKKYKEYAALKKDCKNLQSELDNLNTKYLNNGAEIQTKYTEQIKENTKKMNKILTNTSEYIVFTKKRQDQLKKIEDKINFEKQSLLEKNDFYIKIVTEYNDNLKNLEKNKFSIQEKIKYNQAEYIQLRENYKNILNKLCNKLGVFDNNSKLNKYLILKYLDAAIRIPENDDIITSSNFMEYIWLIKNGMTRTKLFMENLSKNNNLIEANKKLMFLKNYLKSNAFQEDKITAQKELKSMIGHQANYYPLKEMFDSNLIKLIKMRYESIIDSDDKNHVISPSNSIVYE